MGRGMRNDVFVGNIAFGTTDEDIRRIFSEVGRVLGVRMAVNAETGKPRGYCFVEYDDAATALSAIRNLNNRDAAAAAARLLEQQRPRRLRGVAARGRRRAGARQGDAAAARRGPVRARGLGRGVEAKAPRRRATAAPALLGSSGALTDALVHALLQLGMIRAPPDAGGFAPPPPLAPTGGGRLSSGAAAAASRPPPPRRPWTSSTRR
ncbi:hypothetical protein JL720_12717 [Aureococcus anophagefferens]|nr:hypothetical protein JL720_12717 [Aureococcus anophagefferens]